MITLQPYRIPAAGMVGIVPFFGINPWHSNNDILQQLPLPFIKN
jgi:hypothetical protein